jgi:hypothetical protein
MFRLEALLAPSRELRSRGLNFAERLNGRAEQILATREYAAIDAMVPELSRKSCTM